MPWKQDYTTSDEVSLRDYEVEWPQAKRCCVTLVVDLSLATGPEGVTERDVRGDRALFGLNEGFAAVIELLDRYGLKATFPVPAVMARTYGERLVDLQAAGHEIAVHGFAHEDVSELSRDEEADRIALATELVSAVTGEMPTGWFSLPRQSDPFAVGTISAHTIDLLADSDYSYFGNGLADDIPYYWIAESESGKNLLTMPYYYHFDDQFFLMFPSRGTGLEHADGLHANWQAEFEAQHERGRCFSMVLHPHAVGWCNRARLLDRFCEQLASDEGVWNPTCGQCADYWRNRYPAVSTLKLEPSIWADYPGSLS